MLTQKVTTKSISRAISPLIRRRKKPGSLERLAALFGQENSGLSESDRGLLMDYTTTLEKRAMSLWAESEAWMSQLANEFLSIDEPVFRLLPDFRTDPKWKNLLLPMLKKMGRAMRLAADNADQIQQLLSGLSDDMTTPTPQPLLDLKRARRRLDTHGSFFSHFMRFSDSDDDDTPWTLWIDTASGVHKDPTGRLCMAPIEAGSALRRDLFKANRAVIATSATLTVINVLNIFALESDFSIRFHPRPSLKNSFHPHLIMKNRHCSQYPPIYQIPTTHNTPN